MIEPSKQSEAGCSAREAAVLYVKNAAHSVASGNGSAVYAAAPTVNSAIRHKKIPPKDFDGENVKKTSKH